MSRPTLFTRGLSALPQEASPADSRDDAKRNMLKAMRPLPTQHYWLVWFDRQKSDLSKQQLQQVTDANGYHVQLEQIGQRIESVQDFWRYANNTPVDQIKMRESLYLFKEGFRPIWEDRRNVNGGSWTFRVPKTAGPDFWTRVQTMAIGEQLQAVLDEGDQICGVGLSVRFTSHLISIWHRDSSKPCSVDAMRDLILSEMPPELQPKDPSCYFYKRHSDHVGFNAPPELQVVLDSQRKRAALAAQAEQEAQGRARLLAREAEAEANGDIGPNDGEPECAPDNASVQPSQTIEVTAPSPSL